MVWALWRCLRGHGRVGNPSAGPDEELEPTDIDGSVAACQVISSNFIAFEPVVKVRSCRISKANARPPEGCQEEWPLTSRLRLAAVYLHTVMAILRNSPCGQSEPPSTQKINRVIVKCET